MTARKESTNTQVTVVESDAVVATISRARTALAEAKTIQETKHVLDMAAAAEIYARRQKLGQEAEGLAYSIRIEALRKLGEMLAATKRNEGAKGVGKSAVTNGDRTQQSAVTNGDRTPTLEEMGLTKRESAMAQKLAALPEKDFEQVREGHVAVSKAIAAVDATKGDKGAAKADKPAASDKPAKPVDSAEVAKLREKLDDALQAIGILNEENDYLNDRLAVEAMDASEEEKTKAKELIEELRSRIKTLEAELKAVKASRDTYMRESGEKTKQINYWRKRAEKVAA